MKKIILLIIGLVIAGFAAYYGRFYFTTVEVQEEIPAGMETEARVIAQGTFTEIDFIHKGSGKVIVLENSSGHKLLRFENFKVTNGPDLYVYLSRNPQPTGDTASLGDFINLGRLKGNIGEQNYEINQNIGGYQTVVIWCKQFGVLFSYAILQ